MEVPKKHWTTTIGQATGHPAAFGVVLLYALLWLVFDAVTFDWNAVATLGVWMMTLFIQRSNRRDTQALHAKLDELLRVDNDANKNLYGKDLTAQQIVFQHAVAPPTSASLLLSVPNKKSPVNRSGKQV